MEHEIVSATNWCARNGFQRWMEKLEIGERADTIQTTALLRSDRISKRVQETCCYLDSREKLKKSNNNH